jgi:hypothetical protein
MLENGGKGNAVFAVCRRQDWDRSNAINGLQNPCMRRIALDDSFCAMAPIMQNSVAASGLRNRMTKL